MSFFLVTSEDHEYRSYFEGMAFSNESVVFSLDGLESYLSENGDPFDLVDGRFAAFYYKNHEGFFFTDRSGQDCWFYYFEGGFWAVSNSYYALVEKLASFFRLKLNESAFVHFNVPHSFCTQPISDNTMVTGVKILPKDSYIKVGSGLCKIQKRSKIEPPVDVEEYYSRLSCYIGTWKARLDSLRIVFGEKSIRCDISGGLDSRIIFSLTDPANELSRINYSSNKLWVDDFKVAKHLLFRYGLELSTSPISNSRSLGIDQAVELYVYGNAGVYRNVYFPKHLTPAKSLHLHGGGGENIRGNWPGSAWKIIHRLKGRFKDEDAFRLFRKEALSWFAENSIDPKSDESSIIHYRNFRSRFHFGRNWYRSLTNPLCTPLESAEIDSLSDFLIASGRDPRRLQFDLLYAYDPFLAFFHLINRASHLGLMFIARLWVVWQEKVFPSQASYARYTGAQWN
ncbi:hypothetical protein ACTXKF_17305 [Vreelandella alkaliphila]|uniref:hypothetical protein n=1 Tax=Vreelandella alkaliphila TaxID=272774 RepID=UPI003FD77747